MQTQEPDKTRATPLAPGNSDLTGAEFSGLEAVREGAAESKPMRHSWHNDVTVLTGIIGSGKTTVADLIAKHGGRCVNADQLARQAVAKGSEGLAAIAAAFGQEILTSAGELDRSKLRGIVFNDPDKKKTLESITHPIIARLAEEKFEALISSGGSGPLVYDCPLYFEGGLDALPFKQVILVTASPEACLERIMKRDGISKDQAEKILGSQWPIERKKSLSDIIIDNSGTLAELENRVAEVFAKL